MTLFAGTIENPITVNSAGEEQYLGCTGSPADSHVVKWLTVRPFPLCSSTAAREHGRSQQAPPLTLFQTSRERPIERCPECGSVYKMQYIGPQDDGHGHGHHDHGPEEPKTFADYIKPEYRYV